MKSIGVTYGYGSREKLADAGADLIVDTVEELKTVLTEEKKNGSL